MKEEMKRASYEWKKYAVNLQLDSSIVKLKHDPSWGKNFNVQFDANTCRVNLPNIIPEIELPDFDSITVQIERAVDIVKQVKVNIPKITFNIPDGSHGKNEFHFKMDIPGQPDKVTEVNINLDSILRENKYYSQMFSGPDRKMNLDSLLTSIRSMIPDSVSYFRGNEFKGQMKEFQKEMKKFQQQMKEMEKELKNNKKELKEKKDPIEI